MSHAQTSTSNLSDVKIITGNNGTQSTDVEANDFLYVTYLVIERVTVYCFILLGCRLNVGHVMLKFDTFWNAGKQLDWVTLANNSSRWYRKFQRLVWPHVNKTRTKVHSNRIYVKTYLFLTKEKCSMTKRNVKWGDQI